MQQFTSTTCPAIHGAIDPSFRRVMQSNKRRKLSRAIQEHTQTQVRDAQEAKHMVDEVLQLIEGTGKSHAHWICCILAAWPEQACLSCR